MRKFLKLIVLYFIFSSHAYAASFNCHYEYKDKNGIIRADVFATAYVEINTFLKKITFFPIKTESMKKKEAIKFDQINFSKTQTSYKSDKFKQRKLTEKEKKRYKDGREYLWEDVKNEYLNIWFVDTKKNPFRLEISPTNLKNKWLRSYQCYKPR